MLRLVRARGRGCGSAGAPGRRVDGELHEERGVAKFGAEGLSQRHRRPTQVAADERRQRLQSPQRVICDRFAFVRQAVGLQDTHQFNIG